MDDDGTVSCPMCLADINEYVQDWHLNGSVAICGKGADYNVVVLVNSFDGLATTLVDAGWESCSTGVDTTKYTGVSNHLIMRRGKFNIICVNQRGMYDLWYFSRLMCEHLRNDCGMHMSREQRVTVFRTMREAYYTAVEEVGDLQGD